MFGKNLLVVSPVGLLAKFCKWTKKSTSSPAMVYQEKALYDCFIPCHRKYSGQHNQCDISMANDGKVG